MINSFNYSSSQTRPVLQIVQDVPSSVKQFWQRQHLNDSLNKLNHNLRLLKAMHQELQSVMLLKENPDVPVDELLEDHHHQKMFFHGVVEVIKMKGLFPDLRIQEECSLEAVNSLVFELRSQLVPFESVVSGSRRWEERSMAVRLANNMQKAKRSKRWRKKKMKCVADRSRKEREMYEQADRDADEWRAKEIAKDIAKRKVEKMKDIAKVKALEERKRLENEVELVLIVEKLQELRAVRIQKLKKQGHFLPEEDDKFLERVRAAVEEEERLAAAAANTETAKDAIACAEVSRLANKSISGVDHASKFQNEALVNEQRNINEIVGDSVNNTNKNSRSSEHHNQSRDFSSINDLPLEFYHYYHGSNTDMGTLIEVRRVWDAYLKPGGSRIPGHWVQPPYPADNIWASYLVRPSNPG